MKSQYFQEHPEHNWYGIERLDIERLSLTESVNGLGQYKLNIAASMDLIFSRGGHDFYTKVKDFITKMGSRGG